MSKTKRVVMPFSKGEPKNLTEWQDWCTSPLQRERGLGHTAVFAQLLRKSAPTPDPSPDWATSAPVAIQELAALVTERQAIRLRLNVLEFAIAKISQQVDRPKQSSKIVPIGTFAPEPYSVLTPILVVLETIDDNEVAASWSDANLYSTGDNEDEAVTNLKTLILDFYDSYSKETKLGVAPSRQLAVIKQYVRKNT